MQLSEITFYENTPFTKLNETILFSSEANREAFLNKFPHQSKQQNYNIVRDRLTIEASLSFTDASRVNFIKVRGGLDNNKTDFYFQVVEVKYDNDDTTKIQVTPDLLFTYCSIGNTVQNNAKNVQVEREHLPQSAIDKRKVKLGTNQDVLDFNSVTVLRKDFYDLSTNHIVLFNSSISLTDKFGTVNDAEFKTEKGALYDNVITPLGIYGIQKDKWVEFQTYMKDFSWVAQGITNPALIPLEMVDFDEDFTSVTLNDGKKTIPSLKRINNGAHSSNFYPETLKTNIEDWRKLFNHQPSVYDVALFRKNYLNMRVSLNTGDMIDLDPAYLPDKGIDLICQQVLGVTNEFKLYQSEYRTSATLDPNAPKGLDAGLQYENSISFSNFSTIPTVLDPKNLSLGMSSHERDFANSQTPRGQIETVKDTADSALKGDFSSVVNNAQGTAVAALGLTQGTLTGKLQSDYQYYEGQKAKFADMALQSPTISTSTSGQNFGISNGTFGVQVTYQGISKQDFLSAKYYHCKMGFMVNEIKDLESLYTYKNVNYAKFSGNWAIPSVPKEYMDAIKALYEIGVIHYHEDYANSFSDLKPNQHLLTENELV